MIALFAALLLPLSGDAVSPAPTPVPHAEATPIRINLIGGPRYGSGDRVRVQVTTSDDGYLVVLRVDTDGHVRVLFPIDPSVDAFVRGGKTYELRGRADRQTFLADEHNGNGVIYAAVSHEPLKFSGFMTGDHWDYDALRLQDTAADPEAELSRFVAQMTDNGHFDYDILDYSVTGPYIASVGGAYPPVYGSYGAGYDPYWNCLGCRWGYRPSSWGISFGFGGGYYDPWGYDRYDPWGYNYYDPYYYGYGSYYYPGSYWRYPGQGLPITVINLPRPSIPTTPYGFRSRPRTPIPALGSALGSPSRFGGSSGGSNVSRNGREPVPTSPGTRARERTREPVVETPSRTSEPGRSSSPPPSVQRTPPASSGGSSSGSTGTRSRPRGGGGGEVQDASTQNPGQQFAPVSIDRQGNAARPVFREPPRVTRPTPVNSSPGSSSRPPEARPVYREPPRMTPSNPAPSTRSAPPSPAPATRSSPPPSSPPPATPPASSSGRSRSRGGGGER